MWSLNDRLRFGRDEHVSVKPSYSKGQRFLSSDAHGDNWPVRYSGRSRRAHSQKAFGGARAAYGLKAC